LKQEILTTITIPCISAFWEGAYSEEEALIRFIVTQWVKSPKKQSVGLYFWCRINKKKHSFRLLFGDFAHWEQYTVFLFKLDQKRILKTFKSI